MAGRDQAQIDALASELLAAYQRADTRISEELRAIGEEERHTIRRTRLRALKKEVIRLRESLDEDARSWVDNEFRAIYEAGAVAAAVDVGARFEWAAPHEAAIKTLAADTLENLLAATQHMSNDVKRLIRGSGKKATLDKLLLGKTAVGASRELRGELASKGIAGVVYKNGARYGIGYYSRMLLRSQSAIAYNTGAIREGQQQGAKYGVLHDGVGCCLYGHEIGPAADGLVLPLVEALQYPIAHPHCRRSVTVLASVQTAKDAADLQDSGILRATDQQRADEAAADTERAAVQSRHAARLAARDRRLQARSQKIAARNP